MRTRFAPSPTGDLHLGGAWTALASWVVARRADGRSALRFEDLDTARCVRGARERLEDDLRWLGLDWDGAAVTQSERGSLYEEALAKLAGLGLVYPCDCSRAEIARAASAPHEGEEAVYGGLCRDRDPARPMKRPPALRLRVPDHVVSFDDDVAGPFAQNLARDVGDFVLRRGDGAYAYQLSVVVDDAAMGITHVVRGADLVSSTPRQIWLAQTLGFAAARFAHVPLVVACDGARLEKRTRGATVRELRDAGVASTAVIGVLAHGLGLRPTAAPAAASDVAQATAGAPIVWRQTAWPIPRSW